jgi:hypothetical protein
MPVVRVPFVTFGRVTMRKTFDRALAGSSVVAMTSAAVGSFHCSTAGSSTRGRRPRPGWRCRVPARVSWPACAAR